MQLLNKFYMRLASGGLIDSYGELGLILGAFPPLILVRFWGSKRVGNTIELPTRAGVEKTLMDKFYFCLLKRNESFSQMQIMQ